MNVKCVNIEGIDYIIMKSLNINNTIYHLLVDKNDNKNLCIRKEILINNEPYLNILTEEEFDYIFEAFKN